MTSGAIEIYRPRPVSSLGQWEIGGVQFKVYGLTADGREIDQSMLDTARSFVTLDVLPRVAEEGDDNGLGFLIIHPGDLGISILAHWWIQGSVLCQRVYRKLYSEQHPLDTVKRPVIACVWELALINAEQDAWRRTMMKSDPERSAYLDARASFKAA